jgi:hypothetical protein
VLLYDSTVCGNCYKVRLLLAQLGLDYQRREVDVIERSNRLELLGELNPGCECRRSFSMTGERSRSRTRLCASSRVHPAARG